MTAQNERDLAARDLMATDLKATDLAALDLAALDAWWRAANYLAVGMIYLQDNPLLAEPLRPEHIKNRLLGHWGSSPGQAFIWAHANRVIRKHQLEMIYLSGPGHGAPGVLGPTYLDGSYSAIYPDKSQDKAGLGRTSCLMQTAA